MRGQDIQRDLFRLVDRISHEIESFTDGLSDIEKNAAGSLEEWAPRDVITHLVFWQEHFNNKLSNARSGKKAPSAGDYLDQVNDGVGNSCRRKRTRNLLRLDGTNILVSEPYSMTRWARSGGISHFTYRITQSKLEKNRRL